MARNTTTQPMPPKQNAPHKPPKSEPAKMATNNHYVLHQCHLQDIKASCGHDGKEDEGKGGGGKKGPESGAAKHGQAAPPVKHAQAARPGAPPPKPEPENGGSRLAKEEDGSPPAARPPATHAAPAGHPPGPAPAHPPGPGARPPAPPAKNLMLQVVPTAAEAPKKSAESHGVKVTPAARQPASQGDRVTIVATMIGPCSKYPQWKIKDFGRGTMETVEGKTTLEHLFLRPSPLTGVRQFLGVSWLETIKPRHYLVECHVPSMESKAHHRLDVFVYPPDKPEFELNSKAVPKPPWEEKLDAIKGAIEELFKHAADLVPVLANTKIELLKGKVTIKNGWEEIKGSNLAHFKVDADADIELIKISTEVPIPALAFFSKVKRLEKVIGEGEKIERFFKEKIGLYIEAGLYLSLAIGVKGAASWEKEEHGGFTSHLESIAVEEGAALKLEARLDVGYDKDGKKGELFLLSGEASSEMTLSTSPRLEAGPHLWLDNKFSWNPLTLKITAKVHGPVSKDKITPTNKLPTKEKTDAAVKAPEEKSLLDLSWEGEVFKKITDVPLMSIDLLTGATQPHPQGKEQQVIPVKPVPAPWPKPAAPPHKPAAPPK